MATGPQDVIKTFLKSLDNTSLTGENAVDEALRACSKYSTLKELVDNFMNDCHTVSDPEKFLKVYCGIDLDNEDTGAITGFDAGVSRKQKNAEDIVPEHGNSAYTCSETLFSRKGLNLQVPSSNNLDATQRKIINGIYTWWAEEGLNLVEQSYGDNFGFSDAASATAHNISVNFVNQDDYWSARVRWRELDGKAIDFMLDINMKYFGGLSDDVNGKSSTSNADYLDKILTWAFTATASAANITYYSQLPQFVKEGINDLTHGLDNKHKSTMLSLLKNMTLLQNSLDMSNTSEYEDDYYKTGNQDHVAGYMLFRYLAKQTADVTVPDADYYEIKNSSVRTSISGTAWADDIQNNVGGNTSTIDAREGDDVIVNHATSISISGGVGNDSIVNDGELVTINGGRGNDTLTGSDANRDVFQFEYIDGRNVITNYKSNDKIQILSGTLNNTISNGQDVAVIFNKTVVSLQGGKGQTLNLFNSKGNEIYFWGDEAPTLVNNSVRETVVSGTSKRDKIFNSGSNSTIITGDGDDSITNTATFSLIEAGHGYDTILNRGSYSTVIAGAGNDQITLEGTRQVLEYVSEDGNDTVTGFDENDIIKIVGDAVYSTVESNNDVIIRFDNGSITLKDAKDLRLNISSNAVDTQSEDDTTSPAVDDDSTSTTPIDDTTSSVIDDDSTSTTPIDDTTSPAVDDDSTSTTPIDDTTSSVVDDDTTSTDWVNASIGSENIIFNPNKPTTLTVSDPFSGIVDAKNFDTKKLSTIDASSDTKPVVLIASDKASNLIAGSGGSTLYGGKSDDKLYGGEGVDHFVYNMGGGKDAVYDYELKDIVSIVGSTRDKLTFTDKKDSVTINIDGDKKSQLTISKVITTDAITIDINGETFKYGELPTGVTFDDNSKKTGLKVGSTAADGVTVNAADIVSTAKTLDGSEASGSVYLIGNANKNELKAGKYGSTLYGGKYSVADKLIGGDGADVFMYSAGDGADIILNFDGTKDKVMLNGVTELKLDALKWSGDKLVVTVGNQKLTLEDPQGEINFVNDSDATLYSLGINFPSGVGYNKKKTAVTVNADASNVGTIDLSSAAYVETVKEVNAVEYKGALEIIGNAQANVLYAGKGGSTLDGGSGTDKLHGGDGADVFVYDGEGADVIYGFDGTKDTVMLKGETTLDPKNVSVSANKVVVTINNQKLTLDDPTGKINFVNDSGTALYSVGINFPTGVGYDKKKTAVIVGAEASDIGTIDLGSSAYLPTVKEINAVEYKGALNLVGNAQSNILRAGSGNATLNGGYDSTKNKATSDKLYGTTGNGSSDVFVWDAFLGGGDQIYNYSAAAGDIISVTGEKLTIDKKDFKESGNKVVLSAGGGKLTVNDVKDQAVVVVYGDDTITFGSLAGGLAYADNKKSLKISDPFSGTVAADDYASSVVTLDASSATGSIELIGNKKTKAIKGGAGSTTMIGSTANDNFYAGTGADVIVYTDGDGKDMIHDFDSGTDVIKLVDAKIEVTDFVEKGNDIVLTIGKGSITLKDAPRGTIKVEQEGGNLKYKTLPSNVTYKATKEAVTLAKEFSGTLIAADLQLPVKEINGAAATGAADIRGMSTATKITAGKGGGTLTGGNDADTLIGGAGVDVFVTSGGKDFIDKYTAGKDKITVVGTLNAGKVSGSNVELTTSEGTVTIKGVVNKELTLNVGGVESKYKFTKTNTTLDKALLTGNAQLPSEDDYWFLQSDDTTDEIGSMMVENTTSDDAAIGSLALNSDPLNAFDLTVNTTSKRVRHNKK